MLNSLLAVTRSISHWEAHGLQRIGVIMLNRRILLTSGASFSLSLAAYPALFGATANAASALSALDTDKDGTLDLAEVKAAASALFDKLDTDSDATLEAKELKGRLGKDAIKSADPDHDGTLTKEEYLAIVEKLFHKADSDHEGTLDAKELRSKAGQALLRLIK
jgi:hypothetical protein